MGLAAGRWLGQRCPAEKRILTIIVETDGCLIDGPAVKRTGSLRAGDHAGIDFYVKSPLPCWILKTGRAVRIAPSASTRKRAKGLCARGPVIAGKVICWATSVCPEAELLDIQEVVLNTGSAENL